MEVSVIIPLFNAEQYIKKAVKSAIAQPEVKEILIVDDCSTDKSLYVAKNLAIQFPIIKVFEHSDKKNHGVAATRNIGLANATCPYISFLDADDFYLPNRFKKTNQVFNSSSAIDGVYEAIGYHFYDHHKVDTANLGGYFFDKEILITSKEHNFSKEDFLYNYILGNIGWWSLDGFTIKKSLLDKTGYFNPNLKTGEDTDFMIRTILEGNLKPGSIKKAIAKRSYHESNTTYDKKKQRKNAHKLYKQWFLRMLYQENWNKKINYAFYRTLIGSYEIFEIGRFNKIFRYPAKIMYGLFLLFRYPKLIVKLIN